MNSYGILRIPAKIPSSEFQCSRDFSRYSRELSLSLKFLKELFLEVVQVIFWNFFRNFLDIPREVSSGVFAEVVLATPSGVPPRILQEFFFINFHYKFLMSFFLVSFQEVFHGFYQKFLLMCLQETFYLIYWTLLKFLQNNF